MKYKLIATDFDGTLLNNKKKITNKTKNTLIKYKNKGYIIVGVTARTLDSVKNVSPLDIFDYLILNNGSYFYDVEKNEGKYINYVDNEIIESIMSDIADYTKQIELISATTYYVYKNKQNSNLPFIKNIETLEDIKELISRINIFLFNQKDIEYIHNRLKTAYKNINCFIMQDSDSELKWLVINPKGINKKSTLENLGKKLKIKLEEMIFFGDGLNDLEVIEAVGCGVAMKNALEEVKEKSNYITLSNNEDGIAVFLDDLLEPRK